MGVYVSVSEMFTIGIGPSSSHTVGPMRAAKHFREAVTDADKLGMAARYECVLKGSLAATGRGHGTVGAVIAGLRGATPETVDPEEPRSASRTLATGGWVAVDGVIVTPRDIVSAPRATDASHPNELTLRAWSGENLLYERTYHSVGGGFIRCLGEDEAPQTGRSGLSGYRTMAQLIEAAAGGTIAEVAWRDEVAIHGGEQAQEHIDVIWAQMRNCIERGLTATADELPGGLGVRRRASELWQRLNKADAMPESQEVIAAYAIAVNEENAAGNRVVTAPTNGAAGIIPAVLHSSVGDSPGSAREVRDFLLTATAIGSIIRANGSISGAEAGCQAEVGSACAMAAAGLTAIRGGTVHQVENAAEIAIEHHLGLTCDPVGGLVQIPCIERNAIAAATAVTASRLALLGTGEHRVSLDTAVRTMRDTGRDMSTKYKETSTGGLAVSVVEC